MKTQAGAAAFHRDLPAVFIAVLILDTEPVRFTIIIRCPGHRFRKTFKETRVPDDLFGLLPGADAIEEIIVPFSHAARPRPGKDQAEFDSGAD